MNTQLKIAVLGLALVAMTGTALATTQTTGGIAPGSIDISGVAGVGAAFCQNANPAAPLGCGGAGLGVFFDVSTWGLGTGATGSCSVSNAAAPVQGSFAFTCGTDRDDDSVVTNVDTAADEGGVVVSNDADGWDDDFASAASVGTTASVNVCFRSDLTMVDISAGQGLLFTQSSTSPVNGDGSWDDVVFFIGQNNTGVPTTVGAVSATLTLNSAGSCAAVSGHTHGF